MCGRYGLEAGQRELLTRFQLDTVVQLPVILRPDDEEHWLNPDESEADRLSKLLWSYPATRMEAWPVSRAVNNPQHDSADLVQPLNPEEAERL